MQTIDDFFENLKQLQEDFGKITGEYNIYTNSKFYEILIANQFNHTITNGAHGPDATIQNIKAEYKHYKESSSNHSWAFNDYSDNILNRLKDTTVYFVHVNDKLHKDPFKFIDWYYVIDGHLVSQYIKEVSATSVNTRKMINIRRKQLNTYFKSSPIQETKYLDKGKYAYFIREIHKNIASLEKITNSQNLLTSNKLWELFLAQSLGHSINSKQGGSDGKHDASDNMYQKFEYKISTKSNWTFEDVSDNVIDSARELDGIYVATIDKRKFIIKMTYLLDTNKTLNYIKKKRDTMIEQKTKKNKAIRRLNVSISKKELIEHNLMLKQIP